MEIFKHIAPLKAYLKECRRNGKSIGLVPTMGALHAGHLQLIAASKAENDITVATIYINPTQFNNPDDLAKYPRTLNEDVKLLEEVQCDVLFCPSDAEMYVNATTIKLQFGLLDQVMEGKFRPGHFSGVGLIVSKLFHIVQPNHAYFGQKDWQQFAVISKLVEELQFDLTLRSVSTLREPDGLAMSSRNKRLSERERVSARVFFKALSMAKEALNDGKNLQEVKNNVKNTVESEPGISLEYFEVADSKNLNLLDNVSASNSPIMCIAGYVGQVRLIDNMFVR